MLHELWVQCNFQVAPLWWIHDRNYIPIPTVLGIQSRYFTFTVLPFPVLFAPLHGKPSPPNNPHSGPSNTHSFHSAVRNQAMVNSFGLLKNDPVFPYSSQKILRFLYLWVFSFLPFTFTYFSHIYSSNSWHHQPSHLPPLLPPSITPSLPSFLSLFLFLSLCVYISLSLCLPLSNYLLSTTFLLLTNAEHLDILM